MSRSFIPSFLVLLALAACSGPVEDTRPGQPVKHRQDAFKAMLRSFEPMGTMLRTDRYQADEFARLSTELLSLREAPWSYFAADTLYPPTKARATVWERPQDFEDQRLKFYGATDALVQAAQTHDRSAVKAAYDKVHASCKSCHDGFKK